MLYDQFTSVKVVIAKVYRDLQLEEEDRIGDMIEWSAEAMDHIGAFGQFRSTTLPLDVATYTALLPADFHQLQMISYQNRPLRKSEDVFGPLHSTTGVMDTTTYIVNETSLYTPVFLGNVGDPGYQGRTVPSYSIEGRTIRTSFPEGPIVIQYTARVLDDGNWPMIPDTVDFREAVFRYIVYKMNFASFIRGKISPNLYEKLEQDWWRKCKQARASADMPDMNTMQNLATSYLSLKPNLTQYNTFFQNLNNTENRRY